MVVSQNEPVVLGFRNMMVGTVLVGLLCLSCLYITGTLLLIFVRGFDYYQEILTLPLAEQIMTMVEILSGFWGYWFQNKGSLGLSANNYFTVKLFISSFLPVSIYLTLLFIFREKIMEFRPFKEQESVHGTAHWATKREVKKAGLSDRKGLIMGKYKGKYLVAGGYEHTLLFAPTGSGKGVGFVMPNLLFWEESVIVHDVKLENFQVTSGYRQNVLKQKVFCWNPADPDGVSHCYNPLDWISHKLGPMVDDVQKIANFFMPKQEFWTNEARNLLTGILLYLVFDDDRPTTLGEAVRLLRSDDVTYNLAVVLDTMGSKLHPVSYMNIGSFLQKPDKERGSVLSTCASSLELWANPIIDKATSISHFNLQQLKKEKHSIYVGVSPDNITRLKPLLQVFYQQAASFFTNRIPTKEDKYGVLMMMDEFPTLGKMEGFLSGIAYFRGYNVRLFLIVQDTEQLKAAYDAAGMNSFLSNSKYRITFAANNFDTATLISKLLGNKTMENYSYSRPKYLDLNPGARNLSVQRVARNLLLPQEVIQLPRDDQIIVIEAHSPIKCKKITYYKEKFFAKRVKKPAFVPTQKPYDPKDFIRSKQKKEEGE
jgi:type IV secretion system protein VirD4